MKGNVDEVSEKHVHAAYERLSEREKHAAHHLAERTHISRNIFEDYSLLNLFLSMLAALQAPIILMSHNRQAAKDRLSAAHDYEVNLKSELEIMTLHEKLDALGEKQWLKLIAMQQNQLALLSRLAENFKKSPS